MFYPCPIEMSEKTNHIEITEEDENLVIIFMDRKS